MFSRKWHDGLPCPTEEGTPGGGLVVNLHTLACISLLFHIIRISNKISFYFNDFADKHSTKPLLKLVNRESLDRILQSEVSRWPIMSSTHNPYVHAHFFRISNPQVCDKSQGSSAP